ncbi:MAG TPA: DNA-formamidopyrimidine glycosylase family protein [Trebonia sp.]
MGRTVEAARVVHPRAVRRDPRGPAGFEAAMAGRPLKKAERRGKYLWLTLDDDEALLAHLGMSGQLLVGDPDRPLSPHVRARFTFADGGPDLRFTDQRTFGHLLLAPLTTDAAASPGGRPPAALSRGASPGPPDPRRAPDGKERHLVGPAGAVGASPGLVDGVAGAAGLADAVGAVGRAVPVPIAHIAPDPMEDVFDAVEFAARLRRKHTGIKRALLDQSLVSGVGNIYADEALWRAKLHWARPTETLRGSEVSRLLSAVTEVLGEALRAGGTSFDALYVNVNGESGYFDRSLNAYGREGEPCGRCGTPIRRDAFMNRSSYSCPRCQPRPRNAHW